jgi:hypothetical protein
LSLAGPEAVGKTAARRREHLGIASAWAAHGLGKAAAHSRPEPWAGRARAWDGKGDAAIEHDDGNGVVAVEWAMMRGME